MSHPKKIVHPAELPRRTSHSQVITVTGGTLVFVAGITSRNEKDPAVIMYAGDMRGQIKQTCENIARALKSVGAGFEDVVKTTTYTTDIAEYHRASDERWKFFTKDLPTSALIGVKELAHPQMLVEIECMAVVPTDRVPV